MDEQNITPEFFPDKRQRPTLLTVLCILSFLGSGLSGVSLFMVYASYDEIAPLLQELSSGFPGMELFASATKSFFLAGAVFNFFSFIGVNLMWRMRKTGFHFYAGAQALLLFLPLIYITDYPLPVLDGLITVLFIGLYALQYKNFK
jgi:hypothetical protein